MMPAKGEGAVGHVDLLISDNNSHSSSSSLFHSNFQLPTMSQGPKLSPVAVQEPGTTARNDQDEVLKAMLRGEPFELESFKNVS
jgi:hypothetical protein